jgi:hypothetical protein
MNQMMSAFMAIIGVFALYSAFTGKGPAFNNDYPKGMKDDANKMLRKACWVFGPIALVTGVLDYLGYSWAYWVSLATILPGIVVYVIIFRRRFSSWLKKK